jgi:hypothetical protein
VNTIAQSALSTQYVQVLVQASGAGGPYNPTGDPVAFAFTPDSLPPAAPSAWITGSWVTYPGGQYWAQVLVGPAGGDIALAAGAWLGWLRITDDPEVPVLQPFLVQIT